MNLHASSNSALSKTLGSGNISQTPCKILDGPRGVFTAEFLFYFCMVALERRMKALAAHSVMILLIG